MQSGSPEVSVPVAARLSRQHCRNGRPLALLGAPAAVFLACFPQRQNLLPCGWVHPKCPQSTWLGGREEGGRQGCALGHVQSPPHEGLPPLAGEFLGPGAHGLEIFSCRPWFQ